MKSKNLLIFALLAAALLAPAAARAQSLEALRSKTALEAQIEERLRSMISSYLNTKEVAVAAKVNVQVSRKADDPKSGVRKWDDKDELILPGVPAATSMTKDAGAAKAAEAARRQVRLGVDSVNIWIIVGKPVAKDQEAKVKKLVSDALGLDAGVGDTISVESTLPEKPSRALDIGAIVALVCLAVLAAFLYGPFRGFLARLNENLAALAAARKGPAEHKS
ncbi:MAG: hypothetical protein CVU79_05960, partial [Elusimicrobia bacterium HGW-Elusimicrobia-3]